MGPPSAPAHRPPPTPSVAPRDRLARLRQAIDHIRQRDPEQLHDIETGLQLEGSIDDLLHVLHSRVVAVEHGKANRDQLLADINKLESDIERGDGFLVEIVSLPFVIRDYLQEPAHADVDIAMLQPEDFTRDTELLAHLRANGAAAWQEVLQGIEAAPSVTTALQKASETGELPTVEEEGTLSKAVGWVQENPIKSGVIAVLGVVAVSALVRYMTPSRSASEQAGERSWFGGFGTVGAIGAVLGLGGLSLSDTLRNGFLKMIGLDPDMIASLQTHKDKLDAKIAALGERAADTPQAVEDVVRSVLADVGFGVERPEGVEAPQPSPEDVERYGEMVPAKEALVSYWADAKLGLAPLVNAFERNQLPIALLAVAGFGGVGTLRLALNGAITVATLTKLASLPLSQPIMTSFGVVAALLGLNAAGTLMFLPKEAGAMRQYLADHLPNMHAWGRDHSLPEINPEHLDTVAQLLTGSTHMVDIMPSYQDMLVTTVHSSVEVLGTNDIELVRQKNDNGLDELSDQIRILAREAPPADIEQAIRLIAALRERLAEGDIHEIDIDILAAKLAPLGFILSSKTIDGVESNYIWWSYRDDNNVIHGPTMLAVRPGLSPDVQREAAQRFYINTFEIAGNTMTAFVNRMRLALGSYMDGVETNEQAAERLHDMLSAGWILSVVGGTLSLIAEGGAERYVLGSLGPVWTMLTQSSELQAVDIAVEYAEGILPVMVISAGSAIAKGNWRGLMPGRLLLESTTYPLRAARFQAQLGSYMAARFFAGNFSEILQDPTVRVSSSLQQIRYSTMSLAHRTIAGFTPSRTQISRLAKRRAILEADLRVAYRVQEILAKADMISNIDGQRTRLIKTDLFSHVFELDSDLQARLFTLPNGKLATRQQINIDPLLRQKAKTKLVEYITEKQGKLSTLNRGIRQGGFFNGTEELSDIHEGSPERSAQFDSRSTHASENLQRRPEGSVPSVSRPASQPEPWEITSSAAPATPDTPRTRPSAAHDAALDSQHRMPTAANDNERTPTVANDNSIEANDNGAKRPRLRVVAGTDVENEPRRPDASDRPAPRPATGGAVASPEYFDGAAVRNIDVEPVPLTDNLAEGAEKPRSAEVMPFPDEAERARLHAEMTPAQATELERLETQAAEKAGTSLDKMKQVSTKMLKVVGPLFALMTMREIANAKRPLETLITLSIEATGAASGAATGLLVGAKFGKAGGVWGAAAGAVLGAAAVTLFGKEAVERTARHVLDKVEHRLGHERTKSIEAQISHYIGLENIFDATIGDVWKGDSAFEYFADTTSANSSFWSAEAVRTLHRDAGDIESWNAHIDTELARLHDTHGMLQEQLAQWQAVPETDLQSPEVQEVIASRQQLISANELQVEMLSAQKIEAGSKWFAQQAAELETAWVALQRLEAADAGAAPSVALLRARDAMNRRLQTYRHMSTTELPVFDLIHEQVDPASEIMPTTLLSYINEDLVHVDELTLLSPDQRAYEHLSEQITKKKHVDLEQWNYGLRVDMDRAERNIARLQKKLAQQERASVENPDLQAAVVATQELIARHAKHIDALRSQLVEADSVWIRTQAREVLSAWDKLRAHTDLNTPDARALTRNLRRRMATYEGLSNDELPLIDLVLHQAGIGVTELTERIAFIPVSRRDKQKERFQNASRLEIPLEQRATRGKNPAQKRRNR